MNYRLRYWNRFYYLQESRRFLFIKYWATVSASHDLEYIESVYKTLTEHPINNHYV